MFQSTEKNKVNKDLMISCLIAGFASLYLSLGITSYSNRNSLSVLKVLGDMNGSIILECINPGKLFSGMTGGSLLGSLYFAAIVCACLMVYYLNGRRRNYYDRGDEHGEAQWTIDTAAEMKKSGGKKFKEPKMAKEYRETMMDPVYTKNIMFDNTYGLSMDGRKTRKNLHMLVIGGSGAGKTRFFVKPNILQMNSSYIITDPSGELYRDMGQMLKDNNYDVRVFNTFDTNLSMQYNPLSYIQTDPDVTDLVTTLIKNTGEASGDNKYFDDATKLLLSAIILFLVNYCPKSEHDFAHVMQLVVAADVPEGQKVPQSDLDKIFEQVEVVDPHGLALKMYKSFKSTSGKSLKSVLSSTATRLTVFNYAQIERLTCADTISLTTIGDEKTALFIITPPTDNGFNFLVAMMYSQLFSKLYYHYQFECRYLLTDDDHIARPFKNKKEADDVLALMMEQKNAAPETLIRYEYDPMIEKYDMINVKTGDVMLRELREHTMNRFIKTPEQFFIKQNTKEEAGAPFHVRMLMDEFANINEIPGFSEVLATVRKYNMSVVIILQSLSQLKKRYEKDYESIIDNCDTFIFLGSKGQETTEYVSKMLGNQTITTRSASDSVGKSKGTSYGHSSTKRELLTPHELVMLPTNEQVVIVKSVYPFKIPKFELEKHPNFNQSADGAGKRLVIQDHLNLEEKIARLEKENDATVVHRESQQEINRRAQQPVDGWMNKQPFTKNGKTTKTTDKEDEFFF